MAAVRDSSIAPSQPERPIWNPRGPARKDDSSFELRHAIQELRVSWFLRNFWTYTNVP